MVLSCFDCLHDYNEILELWVDLYRQYKLVKQRIDMHRHTIALLEEQKEGLYNQISDKKSEIEEARSNYEAKYARALQIDKELNALWNQLGRLMKELAKCVGR